MKKIAWLALTIALLLSACGGNVTDVTDQIANVAQINDRHIAGVKNGHPSSYPNQTYGEAFDNFFGSPTWKYFVGTKEAPDEDGDGEPDGAEENVDVVEFTGYCTYADVKVKARIQFTLDEENDTFQATYLAFNEVPQNMLMLYGLMSAVFDKEDTATEDSASPLPDNTDEAWEENWDEDYWEEDIPDAPPETSAEDWDTPAASDISAFAGTWQEAEDFYPIMKIAPLDSERCQITISHKYAMWEATGEYDAEFGSISYEDGVYSSRDHGGDWEIEETGCSGWIFYDSPGLLCWFDNDEGGELYFVPHIDSTDE